MSDPFVGRQIAFVGTFLLAIGLVGCASRRHVVPFTFGLSIALQGLVVLAAGLIGGSGASELLLLLLVVSGGTVALVAGAVDDWSRDEGTDLSRSGCVEESPTEEPPSETPRVEVTERIVVEPSDFHEVGSADGPTS